MSENSGRVGLVTGDEWVNQCDRLPKFEKRTSMVMSLIHSYGLTDQVVAIRAREASLDELQSFHSSDYIEHCQKANGDADLEKISEKDCDEFGLDYSCPMLPDMCKLIQWVAGGSIAAAEALVCGKVSKAINWGGGWHHAQRDEASGFCYVNDIVLAIQTLRKKFDRVLYIDMDIHHGDGVQNAFSFTPKVFTFSIHKFEAGYFPGSGDQDDIGEGKGRHYSLNIPLKDGITDDQYFYLFKELTNEIMYAFKPDAVVIQCGADCLSLDPLGGFNLTPIGVGRCLKTVLDAKLPTLVLGGGGYNRPNAARCWTYLTWLILSHDNPNIPELSENIPDTDRFFQLYGPSFELSITKGLRHNLNSTMDINDILEQAFECLDEVS